MAASLCASSSRATLIGRNSGHASSSRRAQVVCLASQRPDHQQQAGHVQRLAAGALSLLLVAAPPAMADLNRFEYDAGGEFGKG